MADDKYSNSKCFILSPYGYGEIIYSELCRRRDTDITYEDRKFIPLHGMLMEVTPERYAEFYRAQNRQRYLDRCSANNGDISVDMLTTDEFNGTDILIDTAEPADNHKILSDKLMSCFSLLEKEEQELIYDLFYSCLTGWDAAKKYAVSQVAIHKRKQRILQKLKKMMDCYHDVSICLYDEGYYNKSGLIKLKSELLSIM